MAKICLSISEIGFKFIKIHKWNFYFFKQYENTRKSKLEIKFLEIGFEFRVCT